VNLRPLLQVHSARSFPNASPIGFNTDAGITEEADDGMEEIDLNNIVEGGRRTRGQVIDFAKAAQENPVDDDDDDEEDDDDFTPPEDEDTRMSG
jgi:TATA-binding protein-associated factor Taf7